MRIRYFISGLISIAVILSPFQLSSDFILRVNGGNITQAAATKLKAPSKVSLEKGKGGIYGRITYNGIPVNNARVIIGSNMTALMTLKDDIIRNYTDNGYYYFSNLSPGTYCLAAGWPREEVYWFLRQSLGGQPQCVSVDVVAGKFSQAPSLPLFVVTDLQSPADGAFVSENPTKFRWSIPKFANKYISTYKLSIVQRDVNSDSLKGKIILKRQNIHGNTFRLKKLLSPGIYWWTVSVSDHNKTITAPRENMFAGLPTGLPGENMVSSLGCGNDFVIQSSSGDVMTREEPTLTLAVISKRKGELNKIETLSELYKSYTKKRRLITFITTDNIIRLGGTKQARKIGETLFELYGKNYYVGLAPSAQVSRSMMVGLCECALAWISEHPWEPPSGLTPSNIKLISLTEKAISKVTNQYFYIKPAVIPAGTYTGQTEDVQTIGVYR